MEINKPLQDWEMSRIAERMSPMEFDQIARSDLGITKVKLDQCKEDAGRNCITFMANSLTAWRDSVPRNKARQLLYSGLTKAADRGLIERRSFMFLITGEENEERNQNNETEWTVCVKQFQGTCKRCISCTTFVLLVLSFWVTLFAFSLLPGTFDGISRDSKFDEITKIIVRSGKLSNSAAGDNDVLKVVVLCVVLGICALLILVSLISECHLCCSLTFVRGQRVQERNRDIFKLVLFLALAWCVYLPTTSVCFYRFYGLKNYKAPEGKIADYLQDRNNADSYRMWDKLQLWFDCCGLYNYTYWHGHPHTREVPDSCCKTNKPNCGNFTRIDEINQNGCLANVTAHVTDQVRYHTEKQRNVFINEAMILFTIWMIICMWVFRKVAGNFNCWKGRAENLERVNDEDADQEREQQVNGDIEEIHPDDDADGDSIINIENDEGNGVNDENGAVNNIMEMEDIVVVHQNVVDDTEHLLE